MADTVRKVEHFSTLVPNRPGQAFKLAADDTPKSNGLT